jgi:hypothetical protein
MRYFGANASVLALNSAWAAGSSFAIFSGQEVRSVYGTLVVLLSFCFGNSFECVFQFLLKCWAGHMRRFITQEGLGRTRFARRANAPLMR